MNIHRLPAPPFVRVRSTSFDGSVLPFPRIVRMGGGLAGTGAADVALQGGGKAAGGGAVVDPGDLAGEVAMWAMLVTHAGHAAAEAWREGFAFRDYSRPLVNWMLADAAVLGGRVYTLYSAEPPAGMPLAVVIHADHQNVFRSVATGEGAMGHAELHNRLLQCTG